MDLVKLDLCEYQAIEPLVHPFSLLREENDPVIEVSPYEAQVIQDASKIGPLESLPNPELQQEILNEVHIPKNLKTNCVLTHPGEEVNVQGIDSWSVFTERLMSWPENQGILFFFISQTLQMNPISSMASLLNAVL